MYRNNTKENKFQKYVGDFGIEYIVDTPKNFSTQKTALCGFLALFSVLLLNVPVFVEDTYAYGTESEEFHKESGETRNLVRNSFGNADIYRTVQNTDDSNEFKLLDERSHLRNNFSYDHPNKINEKNEFVRGDFIAKR